MNPRRAPAVVLAVLAVLGVSAPAQAQQASIALRAQAEPRAARYTLGEVAEVRSADEALARALAATEVGLTPRVGYAQPLPQRVIAQQLERSHPQLRGRLQWHGADAVQVRGSGERLDAQALRALAERTLLDALERRGLRAEVQAARLDDLRLPAGARLSARLPEGWTPAKRMSVWIDVELDGRGYRSVPLWFTVKAEQQVVVARASLRAGAALRAEDVAVAWADVSALAAPPLAADAPLAGLRLRVPVDAGRPLPASAVEPRPAVRRNQPVEVQVALGAVRLQTAGIALADARLGETVKVRNPASNEQYGALVVADDTVRVGASAANERAR